MRVEFHRARPDEPRPGWGVHTEMRRSCTLGKFDRIAAEGGLGPDVGCGVGPDVGCGDRSHPSQLGSFVVADPGPDIEGERDGEHQQREGRYHEHHQHDPALQGDLSNRKPTPRTVEIRLDPSAVSPKRRRRAAM